MRTLSALDAVSPAFSRTKLILFSPYRMGRTWKLAATGYLAFLATFFVPLPLLYTGFVPGLLHKGNKGAAVAMIVVIAVVMVLFLTFFYIFSRLEFAFFDIVLNRGEFVAPVWRKYGKQTWPWIGVKVVIGSLLMVALEASLLSHMKQFFALMGSMKPGQPQSPEFAIQLVSFEFGLFGVFAALFLFGSLLTDFVLPSLALEGAPLAEAFRRFWRLIKQEPGQILGFIFLKVGMGVVGYVVHLVLFYILLIVFVIVMAVVFGLGYLVLHALHVSSGVMVVLAIVIGLASYLAFSLYAMLLMFGILLTFLQSYALYFLGGRYPLIGMMLERSTPVPLMYGYPPPGYGYAPAGYAPPPLPPPPLSPAPAETSIYSAETYGVSEPLPPGEEPPLTPGV